MALEFGADLIYRQFPGWVGNLDNDGTTRTYTFLGRPWYENQKNQAWDYTQKSIMAPTAFGKSTSKYTAPYWSLDGNGFLVSATVPIHSGANDAHGFQGVAGTDVNVAELLAFVEEVKFRSTGTAHLYHLSTGHVAASPQWIPMFILTQS